MNKKKKLSSNMEDYLEAIACLKRESKVARVKDIGKLLGVKNPSVNAALSTLSESGLVVHERYGYVELTPHGEKLAQAVQKRHDMLTKFLTDVLKIELRVAAEDACRMEHTMSPATSKKLAKFIERQLKKS